MPVIDAHQHFWDPNRVAYPWLTPKHGPLYRAFAPADLVPEIAAAGIDGTVLVQAADSNEDTESMLAIAAEHDFVRGVVAWIPLLDPPAAKSALDRLRANSKVRGIRHLIHDEPDPDWLDRPTVQQSLAHVAASGLTFDVVSALPRHLELVMAIAERLPHLRLVLDHLSRPPIRSRGWEPWATVMARCAEYPNVFAKVSGLGTEADWSTWTAADLSPYVEHARRCFGAQRLMFGSDWPVALLAGDYARVVRETRACVAHWSAAEQRSLFGATAAAFYGIPRAVASGGSTA